jgi:uracil-DNA glycosylase
LIKWDFIFLGNIAIIINKQKYYITKLIKKYYITKLIKNLILTVKLIVKMSASFNIISSSVEIKENTYLITQSQQVQKEEKQLITQPITNNVTISFNIMGNSSQCKCIYDYYTLNCVPPSWKEAFDYAAPELEHISNILKGVDVMPKFSNMFRIFELVKLEDIKLVFLGQDPYADLNDDGSQQATGLSFSVSEDAKVPSSLKNIFKEMKANFTNFEIPNHGNLEAWTKQGVFLLNTALSVTYRTYGVHKKLWPGFTRKIIERICQKHPKMIFLLLGAEAQTMGPFIEEKSSDAILIEAAHPSGRNKTGGFSGSFCFSKVNYTLLNQGKEMIDWRISNIGQYTSTTSNSNSVGGGGKLQVY